MTFQTETLMRTRRAHQHERVTFIELFFDLVFVFAVTQLSHALIAHPTPLGLLQTAMLLLGVWWVWIDTAWVTNWLDPAQWPVRLMLFTLMLFGLGMSTAIPQAFADKGLVFGLAFAGVQLTRGVFTLFAVRGDPGQRRNFQRICVWAFASAVVWIAGGLVDPQTRLWVWGVALAIECAGPVAGFWAPGLGRAVTGDWNVEGGHLAERCGLFLIIALGESILVMGATFAETAWAPEHLIAFVAAFVGSVTMWLIYFSGGAEEASEHIAQHQDPGRLARLAYTYFHLPLVAGIIVTAVGDELALAHPLGHTDVKTALAVTGGPAIYLAGAVLFKLGMFQVISAPRLGGIAALAALFFAAPALPPVAMSAAASLVLVAVAICDWLAHRRLGAAAAAS